MKQIVNFASFYITSMLLTTTASKAAVVVTAADIVHTHWPMVPGELLAE